MILLAASTAAAGQRNKDASENEKTSRSSRHG
jgi:hypothetical protein